MGFRLRVCAREKKKKKKKKKLENRVYTCLFFFFYFFAVYQLGRVECVSKLCLCTGGDLIFSPPSTITGHGGELGGEGA